MEGKRIDTKLVLFTLVLVLIVLLLLNFFIKGNSKDEIWDYEKITSASELKYRGEKIEDRQTYYTLEKIVQQYVKSYVNNEQQENKLSYKDYYKYLSKNYKEYLSKTDYENIANKFYKKFKVIMEVGYEYEDVDIERIVKNIYLFENNVYLCELEGSVTKNTGYIAIALDEANKFYNIVYIE